jgi:integrase
MRTIPVSDALVTEMKGWKLRSPFSKEDDLVFPNSTGNYTSHTNFIHRKWPAVFDLINEEHARDSTKPAAPAKFKWHNLRHFAISCWIDAGLQPKTVQTLAGHSTLTMTMDRYGHMFKSEDHRRAMDDIAANLFS